MDQKDVQPDVISCGATAPMLQADEEVMSLLAFVARIHKRRSLAEAFNYIRFRNVSKWV